MVSSKAKWKSFFIGLVLLILVAPFQNCGEAMHEELAGELSSSGVSLKTFTDLNNNVFKSSCLPCHGSGDTDIDFTSHASLTSSPKFSQLYSSVDLGIMPMGSARLPQSEIDAIFAWVQAGSPNN